MKIPNLVLYFLLAYAISWLIWLPLYAPTLHLPVLPYHHALGGLGPMLAAFIVSYRAKQLKPLLVQFVNWRPLIYPLIALLSPFILVLIAAIINWLKDGNLPQLTGLFKSTEFPEMSFIVFLLYNFIFFGLGEETGWRGYALPRLQQKYSALWSAVILTLLWALWHWPLFLYRPGYTQMGVGGIIGWLFSLLTGSVLLSWLYNSGRSGLIACAIFHATIDIAFTADVASPQMVNYTGMLITLWGVTTLFVFGTKRLSRN